MKEHCICLCLMLQRVIVAYIVLTSAFASILAAGTISKVRPPNRPDGGETRNDMFFAQFAISITCWRLGGIQKCRI